MPELIVCQLCGSPETDETIHAHAEECRGLRSELSRRAVGLLVELGFMGRTTGWRKRAACRTERTMTFFADDASGLTGKTLEAKLTCFGCPVRKACLTDALKPGNDHAREFGVRGGTTGRERERLGHDARKLEVLVTRQMQEIAGKEAVA